MGLKVSPPSGCCGLLLCHLHAGLLSLQKAEPWPVQRKFAILIVHEQTLPQAREQANEIKSWLIRRTGLTASQIEVQDGHDRDVNDVVAEDMVDAAENADCVLVVQTANILREPRCLAAMYAAAEAGIPITPLVLLPSTAEHKPLQYDFETAKSHLNTLATSLDTHARQSLFVATAKPVEIVGGILSCLIPNIISKPLGLGVTDNLIDAQMADVVRTLRKRMASAGAGALTPILRVTAFEDEMLTPVARP